MAGGGNGNPRWKHRPEDSNWGDFGPDDQVGRLNLLTPEKVLQGIAEVKAGEKFCLSLPLDYPGGTALHPRRLPPQLRAVAHDGGKPFFNFELGQVDKRLSDVVCDDAAVLYLQYSTQWDSLAHIGQMFDADGDGVPEQRYYNGYRGDEHIIAKGGSPDDAEASVAKALGIETMAETCIQGRAVMIDLHAHFGRERKLVSYDDLMRIMEQDDAVVEHGDLACFHTGIGGMLMEMKGKPDAAVIERSCAALNGHDKNLLRWITDSGVVALISDNIGVEAAPTREEMRLAGGDAAAEGGAAHALLPIHEHCLFKLGIPLGEFWYLTALAEWLRRAGRSRFLLTAPPLRLPGAVGSPACPVATV